MTNYINGAKKREIHFDDRKRTTFEFLLNDKGQVVNAPNCPWQWGNVEFLYSTKEHDVFLAYDEDVKAIFLGKKGYEFD